MLNEVIIGKAVLGGITVLFSLIAFALVLFFITAAGLFLTKRKNNRLGRIIRYLCWLLGTLGSLIIILILGSFLYGFLGFWVQKYSFDLNLVDPITIEVFKTKPCHERKYSDVLNQDCIFEGQIKFKATFSERRVVETKAKALWAYGEDGKLRSLHLFYRPMPLEQLIFTAKPLFKDWELSETDLEEWHLTAIRDPEHGSRYFYLPDELRKNPWVEISFRYLENNTPLDWSLSVKWHWDK